MELFKAESDNHTWNAQRNLKGRTFYVEPDTLRFHHSRVLSSGIADNGLIFWIIESCAADMNNTTRGFRYVVFDLFGTVLSKVEVKNLYRSKRNARAAMWEYLNALDSVSHTRKAIEHSRVTYEKECDRLQVTVNAIAERIGHHKAA